MKKLSSSELELEGGDDLDIQDPNVIQNYRFE
jgi:hypothetical protein